MTKQRPILFSTPMVQGVLEDRKNETRRTRGLDRLNENPDMFEYADQIDHCGKTIFFLSHKETRNEMVLHCPYGDAGDELWVRETWAYLSDHPMAAQFLYKASEVATPGTTWRPSIHMPREAARLFLKITKVRLERLHDISANGAISEGVDFIPHFLTGKRFFKDYTYYSKTPMSDNGGFDNPVDSFKSLWVSINGEASCQINPWVWVIKFERINK